MQYMLLIVADESKAVPPPSESSKLASAYEDFVHGIIASGHFRAGVRLEPSSMATTVREKSGKRAVTDGPATAGREHLGGYFLVECEHLDEAIAIAGRIPGVRLGEAIEIRPIVPTPSR